MRLGKYIIYVFLLLLIFANFTMANGLYRNFKATYSIEFSGMTVAKGELKGKLLDNSTYGVYFSGKTTHFISFFYNLKEIIKGTVDIGENKKKVFYESIEKRSKKTKIIYASFLDNKTAKVTISKNKDKKVYLLKSEDGIFSPISLYVFFMSNKMKIGKTYFRDVVVTKHLYKVSITAIKKTTINLDKLRRNSGKRDALEVELKFYKVEKNGSIAKYKKVKSLIAWISTKPPMIPILIKSWNFVGFFSARLTSLKFM